MRKKRVCPGWVRWSTLLAGLLAVGGLAGQTQPLYDGSGQVWTRTGWGFGAGLLGLHPEPAQREGQWVRNGDTLHRGAWEMAGPLGVGGTVARWHALPTPVLIDRWQVRAGVGYRRATERFEGVLQGMAPGAEPVVLTGDARHLVVSAGLQGLRSIPLGRDFFLDGMLGAGADGWWLRQESPAGPDSLFGHPEPGPPLRLALEAAAGIGYALPKGGFLRLTLEADLLQLSPASSAGGGRVDLLQQGYRPWGLLLQWDRQRARPEIDCSGPPDPKQPGRDLFDPKMRKRYGSR